jgi:hypothetical protein
MASLNQPGIVPSEAAFGFARQSGDRIVWPHGEGTVIADALLRVNAQSINGSARKLTSFDGKPILIDHVMLAKQEFNAFATRHKDRYIVAMYAGTYLNCLDTAYTIFATRGTMSKLGDPSVERPSNDLRKIGDAANRFSSEKAYFEYLQDHMPRCPIRRAAAHALAAIMLTFVLHHEEGHVFWGHVDYLINKRLAQRIAENTVVADRTICSRSFQHLSELDADRFACFSVVTLSNVKYLARRYPNVSFTNRELLLLSWLGCALTGTLLKMADNRELYDPKSWSEHPHGILRARETMLPSRARQLTRDSQDENYMEAFVDTLESLLELAKIWPQYEVFQYAFHVHGDVEDAINAFNASISNGDRRAYRALVEQFKIKGLEQLSGIQNI